MSLEYHMNIKLLNDHNLEFVSLKEGYTGLSESIHVKMPHCWKLHVPAQMTEKFIRSGDQVKSIWKREIIKVKSRNVLLCVGIFHSNS